MKAFIGKSVNKIDAKGRVSVPAPFRAVIQARGLAGVTLYPSLKKPCIEGCGMDQIEGLGIAQEFDPLATDTRHEAIAYLVIGNARELPFDGGGRIVLPEDFMATAKLTDSATFVGRGQTFEIWEPSAFAAQEEALRQQLAERAKAPA